IYSAFHHITQMRVRQGKDPWKKLPPILKTVNIGTRAAVIYSPIDISCGWDANANPIEGGTLYDQEDALKLGSNIVTYCLAEYQYGRFFDHQKVYHQATDATRDQLVLGQIVHNGEWDPTPHGLPNLLKNIDQGTTLNVQFKRVPVELEKSDIFSFPVLYMTGLRQFKLADGEIKRLRQYLDQGGAMVVDCAVGNSEFDKSFRELVAQLYPERKLKTLPADHAIMNLVYDQRAVKLAPMGKQLEPNVSSPVLEAIEMDGALPVIYSRLSLSAGWEQLPRAYNRGYADEDAVKLGVNVFMYQVSH
ncbi:MAG: DUF4159 domain-containing protein, partial [Planctomycetes bacterium]|nr:DUF4159 domain-containing protein [Planctomycetota bacterium]